MALSATQITFLCIVGVVLLARPAHAFGAGNIGSTSKIEGENWRHGDLEDVLLTLATSRAMGGKKFSKLDVKRVYFGNWLRDYSQAVDVGTVKYVSAEAIRLLLWILGFMSFGYGTKEFEVTTERLGCYRPEEHIDNPKDYADNEDARQYDRRLRGPIDERRELAIDPETGMKAYIASENLGIDTSAALIRKLFSRSIELGRRYSRNKNKEDLYEALRLLGTGCHCMEDFSAHSNYTELALIELGERDIFPHVGRNTQVRLRGARSSVYPIVTGTFGGVDFLHSVTGEFDDKVTQSEIQELEGTLQQAQGQAQNTSALQDLLNKVPDGVFGGKDEAGKANELKTNAAQHQMQNTRISPRQPEEWLRYIEDARAQIYPIIEWHDEVMQGITETIEKIPILPDILEQLQDEVNLFVFSLIAPFMLPIIKQIKSELNTGSSAIIQASVEKQHIVFSDDDCSDPTHSMLSKDHFSNVLNEPAGKVAGQVLRWAVPQIIQCWDDERADVDRTINRIIRGIFHHPALRDQGDDGASEGRRGMFGVVEDWWRNKSEREKDGLRDQLSRRGVESGRNHKPGVTDHGHGSAKKLGMPKVFTAQASGAPGGFGVGNSAAAAESIGKLADEAVGGGALGGLVGGLASALGGGVLGDGNSNDNTQSYNRTSYGNDGSRTDTTTRISDSNNRHSQTQYSRTEDRYGNQSQDYRRHEQRQSGGGGRQEETTSYSSYSSETRRYGSGNDQETSSYGRQQDYSSGGGYGSQAFGHNRRDDDQPSYGRRNEQSEYSSGGHGNRRRDDEDDDDNNRRRNTSSYGRQQDSNTGGYSSGQRNDNDSNYGSGGYGRQSEETSSYGGGYGRRQEDNSSYGGGNDRRQQETSSYGRQQQSEYSTGGYGSRNDDNEMPGGFGGGYGRRRDDDNDGGYGNRRRDSNEGGYGGRRRDNDDDDDDNNRGYGGNRGDNRRSREYESGGYGY